MKTKFLRKKILVLCSMIMFLAALAEASGDVEVTSSVEKKDFFIGERIKVEVEAKAPKGIEISFPEKPEETGDFSFIAVESLKQKAFSAKKEGVVYVFSIYETGEHVIPPLKVKYRSKPEEGK